MEAVVVDCCAILVALSWPDRGFGVSRFDSARLSLSLSPASELGTMVRCARLIFPIHHLGTFETASWERVYG